MSGRVLGLLGPPRIERALYGDQLSVVCRGVRVRTAFEGSGGRILLEELYRVEGEVRWGAMAEGRLLALLSDVARPSWTIEARTSTDPLVDALRLTVRTTSRLPLTLPGRRRNAATGRPAGDVGVSFRSLALYTGLQLGLTTAASSS